MNPVARMIAEDRRRPRRILMIGDAMRDVYVHGRLAPSQDGCDKFVEERRAEVPGGVANAARSLEHWFARKLWVGSQAMCVKTRFLVDDRIVWRHDQDERPSNNEHLNHYAQVQLHEWKPEAVLLSDYDKGMLTPDLICYVVDHCRVRGIPCVADAKREPALYEGAILKCNSDYGCTQLIHSHAEVWVVTMGSEPPYGWDDGGGWNLEDRDGPAVRCLNHVGAGDCFAAHLTLALACGLSLKEAAAAAHSAGRVYVQRRHNAPPHPDEVMADLEGASVGVRPL